MIDFHIEELTPKFILRDRTGRALAKGIETALKTMCSVVNDGMDAITDVELMPEWRLDELAWETNCLYDYDAEIAQKRRWIADSIPLYRAFGTPSSIVQYLIGYFDDIEVEEWPGYNGSPFHFRVTVSGAWTNKNEAWAQKAITASKNVRSVMDSLAIGSRCFVTIRGEGAVIARFPYHMTGTDIHAGTWPQENIVGVHSNDIYIIASDAQGHLYPFEITGTTPEINTLFAGGDAGANVTGNAQAFVYPFPATNEDAESGTHPQENMIAAYSDQSIRASPGEASGKAYPYPACGGVCGLDEI